jgi:P4 family phage/plasmid primase-like protien
MINATSAQQLLDLLGHTNKGLLLNPFDGGMIYAEHFASGAYSIPEGRAHRALPSLESLLEYCADEVPMNVYFSTADYFGKKKPRKGDLIEASCLQVDLDFSPKRLTIGALETPDMAGQKATAKVIQALKKLPDWLPEPTAAWTTGGGVQAVWMLDAPTQDFTAVEEANKALLEWFNAQPGVEASGTWNVDRVLRLAGSMNVLSPKKQQEYRRAPAPASLLWLNADKRYALSSFRRSKAERAVGQFKADIGNVGNYKPLKSMDELDQYCPQDKRGLLDWVKIVAVQGRHPDKPKTKDDSRSVWVFDFTCNAVRCRIPDDVICSVLLDEECSISELTYDPSKTSNIKKYLEHQLESAKAAVAKDIVNTLDLKLDKLAGAPKGVADTIGRWRRTVTPEDPFGTLRDARKVFKWLEQKYGPDSTRTIVERNFGPDIAALLPAPTKRLLNGKDLPALVSAATAGLPPTKFNSLDTYFFERGKYRLVQREEFNAAVHAALDDYEVISGMDDPKRGLYRAHVDEIHAHLGRANLAEFSTAGMVLFRNGYLLDGTFYPPDPNVFAIGGPDCDYDPSATCPTFRSVLQQQWPDDSDSIALLQEWMGLNLIDDIRFQAMLSIIGPGASGKGTLFKIMGALIGKEYCAAFDPRGFDDRFALEDLIGKTVAIAGDVRGPFKTETITLFRERALQISGGDAVPVRRKNKGVVHQALRTRLTMGFNEVLDALALLHDNDGAIARRIKVLKTTVSFADRQDTGLYDRLLLELPGIANFALDGLERLKRNGRFTENAATVEFCAGTKRSKEQEFMEDWLQDGNVLPASGVPLFEAYRAWCGERGHGGGGSIKWFYANLRKVGYDHTDNQKKCAGRNAEGGPCGGRSRVVFKAGYEEAPWYCGACDIDVSAFPRLRAIKGGLYAPDE